MLKIIESNCGAKAPHEWVYHVPAKRVREKLGSLAGAICDDRRNSPFVISFSHLFGILLEELETFSNVITAC